MPECAEGVAFYVTAATGLVGFLVGFLVCLNLIERGE